MRMGTFLFGGIVGAAAVVYLSRSNNRKDFNLMSSMNLDQVLSSAKNTIQNAAMGQMDKSSSRQKSREADADLGTVEKIVNEDPQLRSEVDEIMSESSKESSYTSH